MNSFKTFIRKSSTLARPERLRRCLFNVPGSEDKKLNSSLKILADSIVFDLEDGVAYNRKGEARQKVYNALETFDLGKREKAVRINAVGSGLELDDLQVILRSGHLQAIVIPKVNSPQDVKFVARMIDTIAPDSNKNNIRLLACIESAQALFNLPQICQSDSRLDALVFASEDYASDTGIIRTPSRREYTTARQLVVAAAHAFKLQPIDLVCIDYKDDAVLQEECIEGRSWGFLGKQAIHPGQVDFIQSHFSPSQKDVDYATQIVNGYQEYIKQGVGVLVVDGKVVDMPVVKWAEKVLQRNAFIKQE